MKIHWKLIESLNMSFTFFYMHNHWISGSQLLEISLTILSEISSSWDMEPRWRTYGKFQWHIRLITFRWKLTEIPSTEKLMDFSSGWCFSDETTEHWNAVGSTMAFQWFRFPQWDRSCWLQCRFLWLNWILHKSPRSMQSVKLFHG